MDRGSVEDTGTEDVGERDDSERGLRPPFVGLAAGLLWTVTAYFAFRTLRPYPAQYAGLILAGGACGGASRPGRYLH
jgi:hypothetical protein